MTRLLFAMDLKDYHEDANRFVRPSARAIIFCDKQIAMIYSVVDDYYKFPGGGIDQGESKEEALIREVREEAGLIVIAESIQEYGLVHRIQKGEYGDTLVQDNYYYVCKVESERVAQRLDDYEAEAQFILKVVDPHEVIEANRTSLYQKVNSVMLDREARVLEMLLEEGWFNHNEFNQS